MSELILEAYGHFLHSKTDKLQATTVTLLPSFFRSIAYCECMRDVLHFVTGHYSAFLLKNKLLKNTVYYTKIHEPPTDLAGPGEVHQYGFEIKTQCAILFYNCAIMNCTYVAALL